MEALKSAGKYTITEDMKERLADFAAGYATEEECAENIKKYTIRQDMLWTRIQV